MIRTLILILIFVVCLEGSCLARTPLSGREKAYLRGGHSVIKKRYFISKKSSVKSLMAKMKEKKKAVKKLRGRRGI